MYAYKVLEIQIILKMLFLNYNIIMHAVKILLNLNKKKRILVYNSFCRFKITSSTTLILSTLIL